MKGQPRISPIYRMGQPAAPPDPLEQWGRQEKLRRDAWHKLGLVTVRPEEMPEPLRGQVKQWAEDHYGRRR